MGCIGHIGVTGFIGFRIWGEVPDSIFKEYGNVRASIGWRLYITEFTIAPCFKLAVVGLWVMFFRTGDPDTCRTVLVCYQDAG